MSKRESSKDKFIKQLSAEIADSLTKQDVVWVTHTGQFNSVEDYMKSKTSNIKRKETTLKDFIGLKGRGGDDAVRHIVKNEVDETRVSTVGAQEEEKQDK